jgi:hypothetical protein
MHEPATQPLWRTRLLKLEVYIDTNFPVLYSIFMKWQAIIVLLAIAISVAVPPALPLTTHGGTASIGTLDVCHSAAPALSSNGEMPCMSVTPCAQQPVQPIICQSFQEPLSKELLIPFDNEHPPQA